VTSFLKVQAAHDGQVDGAPQVDQVGASLVLNVLLLLLPLLLLLVARLLLA
jgi:hypothetical protein